MFIGQAALHWPQCCGVLLRFTSHPSFVLLLQSPKPITHESNTHMLFTHLDTAFGMLHCWQVQPPLMHTRPCGQALPHAPQFRTSVAVMTSQPLFAILSQSAKPILQPVTTQI